MDTLRTPGPTLDDPLLAHLGRLFGDPSRLDEFRQWFSNALWAVESGREEVSDDIYDLYWGVENLLGVLDAGYWTVYELIPELKARATEAGVDIKTPAPFTTRQRSADSPSWREGIELRVGTGRGVARSINRNRSTIITLSGASFG